MGLMPSQYPQSTIDPRTLMIGRSSLSDDNYDKEEDTNDIIDIDEDNIFLRMMFVVVVGGGGGGGVIIDRHRQQLVQHGDADPSRRQNQ